MTVVEKAALGMTFLVFVLGAITMSGGQALNTLKREAIERGYALHCPENGRWAWKGECDE